GAFVGELGRSHPVDGIRAGLFADLHEFIADPVDRLVPGGTLPQAAGKLHRALQPADAVHELANACTLGTMGTAIDRAVPGRLPVAPTGILDFRGDGAADGAMRADALRDLDRNAGLGWTDRRGLPDGAELERADCGQSADGETGA